MKYQNEAEEIVKLVGGPENVRSVLHCATRLRFELNDESEPNDTALEALPYVLKVIVSGGQHQVVIGPGVHDYYLAVKEVPGIDGKTRTRNLDTPDKRRAPLDTALKVISGAFSPIIPLMAGSGMIKAALTLLTTLELLSASSSSYLVLAAAGNACFYFMPVFLGYTISDQLGSNPFTGAAIGAALLEPNFTGLVDVKGADFLGISLQVVGYGSTIFPIFIAAIMNSFLDRGLRKLIKAELQLFLVPMICLMVMVPFTALLFGPFGNIVGGAIAGGVSWLFSTSRLFAGLILGAVYPYLTILGLHWGFTPITLQNLDLNGGDFIEGVAVCAVWAQIGIALGCFLKARRHSRARELSGPTFLTGILAGVTEPILYGLIMNHRRLMAVVAIAGGLGGAWNATIGATMDAYVFHNIFSVVTLVYSPMPLFLIGIGISFLSALVLTFAWGIVPEEHIESGSSARTSSDETAHDSPRLDPTAR